MAARSDVLSSLQSLTEDELVSLISSATHVEAMRIDGYAHLIDAFGEAARIALAIRLAYLFPFRLDDTPDGPAAGGDCYGWPRRMPDPSDVATHDAKAQILVERAEQGIWLWTDADFRSRRRSPPLDHHEQEAHRDDTGHNIAPSEMSQKRDHRIVCRWCGDELTGYTTLDCAYKATKRGWTIGGTGWACRECSVANQRRKDRR